MSSDALCFQDNNNIEVSMQGRIQSQYSASTLCQCINEYDSYHPNANKLLIKKTKEKNSLLS